MQVSTWFANARRRLKKENRMTWSPRNRCGDERNSDDEETEHEKEPGIYLPKIQNITQTTTL